jgi:hypothetical protein
LEAEVGVVPAPVGEAQAVSASAETIIREKRVLFILHSPGYQPSFCGSPANQEHTTSNQTDQRTEDKADWTAGFVAFPAVEHNRVTEKHFDEWGKGPDDDYPADEANHGEDYSTEEYG